MRLAAIDIGSNGARMLISRVLTEDTQKLHLKSIVSFKKIEYTRYALRLGKDVFYHQEITPPRQEKLFKLMQVFKLLMELNEVDHYWALATSAFREAKNGQKMVEYIQDNIGIQIEIIEGSREAEILSAMIQNLLEEEKTYLHIDVGGGSTELNLYQGKEKIKAQSFRIGSARGKNSAQGAQVLLEMQEWIQAAKQQYLSNQEVIAVGTGGNINKALRLAKAETSYLSQSQLEELMAYLKQFTFKQKVHVLKLNPDRADSISPALEIYAQAMKSIEAEEVFIPKVGLKDAMMPILLKKHLPDPNIELVFT